MQSLVNSSHYITDAIWHSANDNIILKLCCSLKQKSARSVANSGEVMLCEDQQQIKAWIWWWSKPTALAVTCSQDERPSSFSLYCVFQRYRRIAVLILQHESTGLDTSRKHTLRHPDTFF